MKVNHDSWYTGIFFDLSEFKGLELTIHHRFSWSILINLYFIPKTQDHHGVRFEINILGYGLEVDFYDSRHKEHFSDCKS